MRDSDSENDLLFHLGEWKIVSVERKRLRFKETLLQVIFQPELWKYFDDFLTHSF